MKFNFLNKNDTILDLCLRKKQISFLENMQPVWPDGCIIYSIFGHLFNETCPKA